MDTNHLGNIGERIFCNWCSSESIDTETSVSDMNGWDVIAQFDRINVFNQNNLHDTNIRLNCQIKTTSVSSKTNNDIITLSNLHKLACDSQPSFYIFITLDDNNEVTKLQVVHLNEDLIYKILNKVSTNIFTNGNAKLNKKTMRLGKKKNIEKPYSLNLKKYFLNEIGESFSCYIRGKLNILEKAGYKEGTSELVFDVNNMTEEDVCKLVAMSVGYKSSVIVSNAKIKNKRFGNKYIVREIKGNSLLEMYPSEPNAIGSARLGKSIYKTDFKCFAKLYTNPIMMNYLPEEKRFVRIDCEFFEIKFYPYSKNFVLNTYDIDMEKHTIQQLIRWNTVATLLCSQGNTIYLQINISGIEIKFTIHSKYMVLLESFKNRLEYIKKTEKVLVAHNIDTSKRITFKSIISLAEYITMLTTSNTAQFRADTTMVPKELKKLDISKDIVLIDIVRSVFNETELVSIYSVSGGKPTLVGNNRISTYLSNFTVIDSLHFDCVVGEFENNINNQKVSLAINDIISSKFNSKDVNVIKGNNILKIER